MNIQPRMQTSSTKPIQAVGDAVSQEVPDADADGQFREVDPKEERAFVCMLLQV